MANRSYSMREDGALILNVDVLLQSTKVQRDLGIIKEKIKATEATGKAWRQRRAREQERPISR